MEGLSWNEDSFVAIQFWSTAAHSMFSCSFCTLFFIYKCKLHWYKQNVQDDDKYPLKLSKSVREQQRILDCSVGMDFPITKTSRLCMWGDEFTIVCTTLSTVVCLSWMASHDTKADLGIWPGNGIRLWQGTRYKYPPNSQALETLKESAPFLQLVSFFAQVTELRATESLPEVPIDGSIQCTPNHLSCQKKINSSLPILKDMKACTRAPEFRIFPPGLCADVQDFQGPKARGLNEVYIIGIVYWILKVV